MNDSRMTSRSPRATAAKAGASHFTSEAPLIYRTGMRALMVRVLVAASVVAFALVRPGEVQSQVQSLDTNSAHLAAAVAVAEGIPEGAVWPGYKGPGEFILCSGTTTTILALREPPPDDLGASLVATTSGGAPSIYTLPGQLRELTPRCVKLFNYSFDGRAMFAFPALDKLRPGIMDDARFTTTMVLFHEAFHLFQREHFAPTRADASHPLEEPPRPPAAVLASPEFQRFASEERAILGTAISTTSRDSIQSLLERYLDVRTNRSALFRDDLLHAAEAHSERKEGSAQLVGYEAAAIALGEPYRKVIELVRADLREVIPFDQPFMGNSQMSSYRHEHIYATGAAIGLLLDKLDVEWRKPLQNGSTFLEILKAALAADPECGKTEPKADSPTEPLPI